MSVTITRKLEFDAGHRVLGHEGKCAHIHGHRYVAEITVRPRIGLDMLGRVVDFSVIKSEVGEWIDKHWDHNILLNAHDPLLLVFQNSSTVLSHSQGVRCYDVFKDKCPYVMPNGNPTAENIAEVLAKQAYNILEPLNIIVLGVRIWETPNCWADFTF
jgi:6-pyruvoyltetrahydropterin/6-carboxytetrahydropterin synthase